MGDRKCPASAPHPDLATRRHVETGTAHWDMCTSAWTSDTTYSHNTDRIYVASMTIESEWRGDVRLPTSFRVSATTSAL